ncbi:nonspecific acid phosphatase [Salmonella bongori]|nr:nonspecific acid phosphatase [Salmonella bongori]
MISHCIFLQKKGMKTPQWRDAQQTVDLNDINALFANATGLDLDKKHMPETYSLLESFGAISG